MKIFVKGNFFIYIDSNNLVWTDNCENAIVYKNSTTSTTYNILLKSSNTRFTDIPFASINDETNTPYATQDIFEEYIYENTGVRFQQPLIALDDLNDVVVGRASCCGRGHILGHGRQATQGVPGRGTNMLISQTCSIKVVSMS